MTLFSITRSLPRQRHQPGFWAGLRIMANLARQRRDLADLDDHLLRDIGITRSDALKEADRLPWDAPQHWLR